MSIENEQPEERRVNKTFIADDPNSELQRKLTMLGFCFFRAALEGEFELAHTITTEAVALKNQSLNESQ